MEKSDPMTYVCERCGHIDNPIWKPLYWRLYWSFAPFADFEREYPTLAKQLTHRLAKTEDQYFVYQRRGKTRDVVHRYPKALSSMMNRKIYEKTPSEMRG